MENQMFSTRDIVLAATLIVLKFPMVGVDLEIEGAKERTIGYFKFPESPEIRKAKVAYAQGSILVEPRGLANAIQNLKSQVVNESRDLSLRSA